MRRIPAKVLSLIVLLAFPAASGGQKGGVVKTPGPSTDYAVARQLAEDAVIDVWPSYLDEVRIKWPDEEPVAIPKSGEVYLISGYFSYTCTRLVWDLDGIRGRRVSMERRYAHNWEGESFRSESFGVDRAALERAWRAAHLLLNANVHRIKKVEGLRRYNIIYSSNAHTYWIRLRKARRSKPVYNQVFGSRVITTECDLPDFEYVRTMALFSIFHDLVPPKDERKPAELADWAPFFVGELSSAVKEFLSDGEEVESSWLSGNPVELLFETSLRAVGQLGAAEAEKPIRALHARLSRTGGYSVLKIRREAERALERIGIQKRWDPEEAARLIRATPRDSLVESDQVNWIRGFFFRRDPEGYRTHLLSDLADPATDDVIMREVVAELAIRYPKYAAEDLPKALDHASPEIAADAAIALLDQKPDHSEAIAALNRLASNPAVTIPVGSRWSSRFARARALSRLASKKMPAKDRWNAEHIRRQLRVPGEDGRMIRRLIQELKIMEVAPSVGERQQAYRQALKGKPNCGVVFACQELKGLGDHICEKEQRKLIAAAHKACPTRRQDRSRKKRWPAQTYYRFRRLTKSRSAKTGGGGND